MKHKTNGVKTSMEHQKIIDTSETYHTSPSSDLGDPDLGFPLE
jgi:hypothetical protein